jgi:hypothetical protein
MIQRPLFDLGLPTWDGEGRDPLDRYYTPEWATQALLDYMGDRISGVVWEPCCGADMIGRVVRHHPGVTDVLRSDVDPDAACNVRLDFLSGNPPRDFDWLITNPPYVIPYNGRTATASDFVRRALQYSCGGVAMLLRLSWLEPCQEREDIFRKSPPTDVLILPRVQFINAPGSNNMTSVWVIWDHARKGETTTMRWHYE